MVKRVVGAVAIAALLVSAGLAGVAMAEEDVDAMIVPELEVVGNVVCPVTGGIIEELGKYTVEYDGKVYNLCCADCEQTFLSDPGQYAALAEAEVAAYVASEAADEAAMAGDEAVALEMEGEGTDTALEATSNCTEIEVE